MMVSIGNLRLHAQAVSRRPFATPEEVVAWMGAMQGRGYTGVKWSVGLRMSAATDEQIEQAIHEKRIIRTWLLRGTLHLVTPQDIFWMTSLVAEKLIRGGAARNRQLELDSATFSRANDIIAHQVRDYAVHTRDALFALLQEQGISVAGQRGVHLMHRATMEGILCQGVSLGNMPTFYSLDVHAHHRVEVSHDEALARLAQRYFQSHAPATLADLCRWASITKREAVIGFDAVRSQFHVEPWEGREFIFSDKQAASPNVYLLSDFDEFVLGYADRTDIFHDPGHFEKVVPGGNGVFYPTVVADGRVIGTWRAVHKKNTLTLHISPFMPLSDAIHAQLAQRAQHFAAFHQRDNVQIKIE